jgi:hypothetical protein
LSTSRLSHLAVVDALFVGVAFDEQERTVTNQGLMAQVTADRTLSVDGTRTVDSIAEELASRFGLHR